MMIDINDLKFKFRFRDDPEFLATMTLVIGPFEIKSFRVFKSQFEENVKRYFIKPPANRGKGGKWIDIFWTNSKDDWALLEEKALEQFAKEQDDYLLGKFKT